MERPKWKLGKSESELVVELNAYIDHLLNDKQEVKEGEKEIELIENFQFGLMIEKDCDVYALAIESYKKGIEDYKQHFTPSYKDEQPPTK